MKATVLLAGVAEAMVTAHAERHGVSVAEAIRSLLMLLADGGGHPSPFGNHYKEGLKAFGREGGVVASVASLGGGGEDSPESSLPTQKLPPTVDNSPVQDSGRDPVVEQAVDARMLPGQVDQVCGGC